MTTELALRNNGTDLDVQTLGRLLASSGYFKDAREMAQAAVKVLAARELGVGPIAGMTGIHIIEGKVTISAGLMASAVKRTGKYDYRVKWEGQGPNPTACAITFYQGADVIGESSFTTADADAAGLLGKAVWKQYRRNMLFARALSNGVRWYCPDVFDVGSVYTPEELGAEVNAEGEAIIATQPPAAPDRHEHNRFWAAVKGLGVTNDQAHEILGVESIKDVPDLHAAFRTIQQYVSRANLGIAVETEEPSAEQEADETAAHQAAIDEYQQTWLEWQETTEAAGEVGISESKKKGDGGWSRPAHDAPLALVQKYIDRLNERIEQEHIDRERAKEEIGAF